MSEREKCAKCESTRIMNDVRVVGNLSESLGIQVQKKPRAKVFKGTVGVNLKARVCATCGYTELYAVDLENLNQVHNRALAGELSLSESTEALSIEDRLHTVNNLLEKGLINESEHAAKRATILEEV